VEGRRRQRNQFCHKKGFDAVTNIHEEDPISGLGDNNID